MKRFLLAFRVGFSLLLAAAAPLIAAAQADDAPLFQPFLLDESPGLRAQYAEDLDPEAVFYRLDPAELNRIVVAKPAKIGLALPRGGGITDMLLLERRRVTAPGYRLRAGTKDAPFEVDAPEGAHYRGVVAGSGGRVAISFFSEMIMGVVLEGGNTYNLGAVEDPNVPKLDRTYMLVNDRRINENIPFNCMTDEAELEKISAKVATQDNLAMTTKDCRYVGIYFECDFEMYNDFGSSVPATESYVQSFFNVVAEIFANEGMNILISDIFVWTATDPYVGGAKAGDMLPLFRTELANSGYTGDLAHLLSTRSIGGGIASLDRICRGSTEGRSAVSGINTSFNNLPAYSWTINVVAHELGHNFGSPHTHNCRWPGGPIDYCEDVEDSTGAANLGRPGCVKLPDPTPPFKGTIMSYCHTVSGVGVNLNLGFGPLPGNLMRDRYNDATCLSTFPIEADIATPGSPYPLCPGDDVTLTAVSCTECAYQWERDGTALAGETNLTLTTNQPGAYTVVSTRLACSVRSEPLQVYEEPTPCFQVPNGVVSGGTEVCVGAPTGTLTLNAHNGNIIRWESSTDNFETFAPINNTTNTLNTGPLALGVGTTCFRAVVDNGGNTEYSLPECVVVHPEPNVNINVSAAGLCQGEIIYLGAEGAESYQWYNLDGSPLTEQYPNGQLTNSGEYRVEGTDLNGCVGRDTLEVDLSPGAEGIELLSSNLCIGDQASLQVIGTPNGTSLQWQIQPGCSGGWSAATGPGATTGAYTTNPLPGGETCYRLRITDGGLCEYTSNEIQIAPCGDIKFRCGELTYTQDFNNINPANVTTNTCSAGNTLGWTDDATIPGWYAGRVTPTGTINYLATNGMFDPGTICGALGITFLGDDGSAERALGSWYNGGAARYAIGAKFVNETGGPISRIDVEYFVEQWTRRTSAFVFDKFEFQYSLDAASYTDNGANWVDVNALDAFSVTTFTTGSLDGNNASFRNQVAGAITGLNVPDGATIWFRWIDGAPSNSNANDHLAIDDFTATATTTGGLNPPVSVTNPASHCNGQPATYDAAPVTGAGVVRYNWTIPSSCAGWSLASPNGTAATTMDLIAGPAACPDVEVTATDDCGTSLPMTFSTGVPSDCPSDGGILNGSTTVCAGPNSANLTLTGFTGSIIRWERSTDNFATVNFITNTTPNFTANNLPQTTCFRAVVQNGALPPVNSTTACVAVSPPSFGGAVTAGQTICPGDAPNMLSLNANVGDVVRWESSTDGFSTIANNIANTAETYNPPAIFASTCFRAVVKSGACPEANSGQACVDVIPTPAGGTISGATTHCTATNSGTLTLNGAGAAVLRWESSTDNFATSTPITNTGNTQGYSGLSQETCYRAVIDGGVCGEVFSDTACIEIGPTSSPGIVSPSIVNVCDGEPLDTTFTVAGHTGNVVRWETSTDFGISWQPVANTTTTLNYAGTPANLIGFRAITKDGICPEQISSQAFINVQPLPTGGSLSGGTTLCGPTNAGTLEVQSFVGSVVQWETSTDNFTTVDTVATTNPTLDYNNVTQTTQYRVVVSRPACPNIEAYSNVVVLDASQIGAGGFLVGNTTGCAPASGVHILAGASGPVLRWEASVDNFVNTAPINNQTTTHLYSGLTQDVCYRAVTQGSGACPEVTSAPQCVDVSTPPTPGVLAQNPAQFLCSGDSVELELNGYSGTDVTWEVQNPAFTGTYAPIPGLSGDRVKVEIDGFSGYRAVVRNGACPAVRSNEVIYAEAPEPADAGPDITTCLSNINLDGNVSMLLSYLYEWRFVSGPAGAPVNVGPTNGSTGNAPVAGLSLPGKYVFVYEIEDNATGQNCPSSTDTVVITKADPSIALSTLSTTTVNSCNGSLITLTGTNTQFTQYDKIYFSFLTAAITNPNDTAIDVTVVSDTELTFRVPYGIASGAYNILVDNAGSSCTGASSNWPTPLTINITTPPTCPPGQLVDALPSAVDLCQNPTVTLTGNLTTFLNASEVWFSTSSISINTPLQAMNVNVISDTELTFQVPGNVPSGNYWLIVPDGGKQYAPARNFPAPINISIVNAPTIPGQVTGGGTVCNASSNTTLTLQNATGNVLFWEMADNPQFNNAQLISNPSATYVVGNPTRTMYYRARVQSGSCPAQYSGADTVAVDLLPAPKPLAYRVQTCGFGTATLAVDTPMTGLFNWYDENGGLAATGLTHPANFAWNAPPMNGVSATFYLERVEGGCSSPRVPVTATTGGYAAPANLWDRAYGGEDDDVLKELIATDDGGYLLVGYTESAVGGEVAQPSFGGDDFWVVKTSASGALQWTARLGGVADDVAADAIQTMDGGYLIAGTSESGLGGGKSQASQGGKDYWIVKLDAGGNQLWDRTFGGAASDELAAVAQTIDGGFVLAGSSNSGVSGDKNDVSRGSYDYWIVKTDNFGNLMFDVTLGGAGTDRAASLVERSSGDIMVVGSSTSPASGEKSQNGFGGSDFWATLLDMNGVLITDLTIGGNQSDEPTEVINTADGDFAISGYSSSTVVNSPTAGNYGSADFWLVKLGLGAQPAFARNYGGADWDGAHDLIQLPDEGYLLLGGSISAPGGSRTAANRGGYDYWAVRTDRKGGQLWDKALGGMSWDLGEAVVASTATGYVFGGSSSSTNTGDRSEVSRGASDYWIVGTTDDAADGGFVANDTTVCPGNNSGTLTAFDFTGNIKRWESSTDGFNAVATPIAHTDATYAFNNLTATTQFRAVIDAGGCEVVSQPATVTVVSAATGTVSGPGSVCSGGNNGVLTLAGNSGAVIRWESSTDNFNSVTPINNTSSSLSFVNLTQTTNYRAVTQSGICPEVFSAPATVLVQPCASCEAPGVVWASRVEQTFADLYWTATTGAIAYEIQYRSLPSGTWKTLPLVSNPPATIPNLTGGATYEARVRAFCGNGSISGYTTSLPFTTTAPPIVCTAPTITLSSPAHNTADIAWTASANATQYRVRWRLANGTWNSAVVSGTSYTITGLSSSTLYETRVQAICGGSNTSVNSDPAFFTTTAPPATGGCPAPGAVTVTPAGASSVSVSWTPVNGLLFYTVYYRPVNTSIWFTRNASISPMTITGFNAGFAYEFRIRGYCTSTGLFTDFSPITTYTAPSPRAQANEAAALNWRVYPNPTNGDFTVAADAETSQDAKLRISDAAGRELYERRFRLEPGRNELPVRLEGFSAGVYLMTLETDGSSRTLKLIMN